MRWPTVLLGFLAVALAQDSSTESSESPTSGTVVSVTTPVAIPSGTYQEFSTTITLSDGDESVIASTTHYNGTMTASNQTAVTTTSDSLTLLVGGGGGGTTVIGNNSMNATATTTGTATNTPVVNTRPCNSYPEFCTRKYSNITMVATHNSPFVRKNSVAANQALDVTTQLNDGVRTRKWTLPFGR
jgi:hypothetical protein